MNKFVCLCLLSSTIAFGAYGYNGSTTSAVTLVGGIIKAQHMEVTKKYNRKDCPVCKGKGWYISGDGIQKVDCGYCEPTKEAKAVCEKECTKNLNSNKKITYKAHHE
jgi:hypothetical protein